ncbi:16S rRNA (cytosine(967)-C(5))-methyltransferase RsmB [Desulfofustis limnaeus]|jgi:16S rRNA (cytosine967-C5)-methyltransferase|nr:16S rRNA (cytosine(967)-C(5))-methyltransferase RsmB [Desulfofustis limnaeus]MDX9895690.1 16S rRNA (cytosine(967)-C(5))-methyltransferase RsmB [Desulfofustis sp.]
MATNARYAAIETLSRLGRTRRPVSSLLAAVVEQSGLQPKDRHLVMHLVFGVLRHRDQLDFLVAQLCARPTGQIHPWVRQALTVGLYQIFFLDRTPTFAAVNETVEALRQAGLPKKLLGFTNAILREALRRKEVLAASIIADPGNPPLLNHPAWLTERWQAHFGADIMQAICAHNNREPILCLRAVHAYGREPLRHLFQKAGLNTENGAVAPESVLLPDFHGEIPSLPGFQDGLFQIQDQSAQLATYLLAPFSAGRRYLDCCAGLGGKTTHLAELVSSQGSAIMALEPDPGRFRLLQENLARCRSQTTVSVRMQTLEDFCRSCTSRFDAVLIDAPCSGTGVIGRQPDIRWNRRAEELPRYQQRQRALLKLAATLLVPGGILVYATCSIEPEENQQVVAGFLNEFPAFRLTDCREFLASTAHHLVSEGFFRPLPGRGQDGFFAARLLRKG